jgi:hypothetical protein
LVTIGDLQVFKEELLSSIKAIIQHQPQLSKRWLKSYEVKKLFGISTGTLQNLRSNGSLPFTRMGGLIYYDADEINKILTEQSHKQGQPFDLTGISRKQ